MCYTGDNSEPGAPGGCVAMDMCYGEKHHNEHLNEVIAQRVVDAYAEIYSPGYKALFDQVLAVDHEYVCGAGQDDCKKGTDCLFPPNASPATLGQCYKKVPDVWEHQCQKGIPSCAETHMCLTTEESMHGSVGVCVPKDAATCKSGSKKPCPTGWECTTAPGAAPGADGYCVAEEPCEAEMHRGNYLMYWQFSDMMYTYIYDLSPWAKAWAKAAIEMM
jgi:hypothetical protein